MADNSSPRRPGLEDRGALEAFLALTGSGLAYLQARLELVGLEGRDAGFRLLVFLLWLGLAIVLALGGYVFGVVLFYMLLRTWLGLSDLWLSLIFLLAHGAGAVIALVLAKLRLRAPFFPHSVAQLAQDRAWLNRSHPPEDPKP